MMNFEEFKNSVAEDIRDFLPDEYRDTEISLREVTKNNDQILTGLVIRASDVSMVPIIYLEPYFKRYENGEDLGKILRNIAMVHLSRETERDYDVKGLTDFEQVRDRISCRLVNQEMNSGYLSGRPYTQLEDLAVIYDISLDGRRVSTPVTNELMQVYGITVNELHEIALHNLADSEIELINMWEIAAEEVSREGVSGNDEPVSMQEEAPFQMYVLTNAEKLNGATAALDKKTMEDISVKMGGDFVVVPSSIHEMIILPVKEGADSQRLEQMVQEMNATQVAPEDRLSNHVYQYDSTAHELVRMDRLEERRKQQEEVRENAAFGTKEGKTEKERVSVKNRLAAKRTEAGEKETGREISPPAKAERAANLE